MGRYKSQGKLSEYRRLMALREGLSFSDYFDDSVPYEVKPVPSTIPMEESGDHLKLVGQGWLDKHGNYFSVTSHYYWAVSYLKSKNIKIDEDEIYYQMYALGFVRIENSRGTRTLNFDHDPDVPISPIQYRIMKNYCIENRLELFDDTLKKEIDLNENLEPCKNYGEDYPLRAKDLYKGLWESNVTYIAPGYDAYWLDKDGKFHETKSHYGWAKFYLQHNSKPTQYDTVYDAMYRMGFVRISIDTGNKVLHVSYGTKGDFVGKPNRRQWRGIIDLAIDRHYSVYDDTLDKDIELQESLIEDILTTHGSSYGQYWMTPDSKFMRADEENGGHQSWAMDYLDANKIPYDFRDPYREDEDENGNFGLYKTLYLKKFVRIVVENNAIFATNKINGFTNGQLRKLKESAIDSDKKLFLNGKRYDLDESKYVYKGDKQLFIESMMPDNLDTFKSHLVQLFAYLQKELQLKTVPKVKLISDEKNADKVLGKTAYYNPDEKLVVLYITNRHQKDILRSFAHEIIHHWQHENEKLHEGGNGGTGDPQYAQNNPWLRQMEKQAYLLGNILFRDWEDQKKAKDKKSGYDGKTPNKKKKSVAEKTYSLGNEYPPKKMDYRG